MLNTFNNYNQFINLEINYKYKNSNDKKSLVENN